MMKSRLCMYCFQSLVVRFKMTLLPTAFQLRIHSFCLRVRSAFSLNNYCYSKLVGVWRLFFSDRAFFSVSVERGERERERAPFFSFSVVVVVV